MKVLVVLVAAVAFASGTVIRSSSDLYGSSKTQYGQESYPAAPQRQVKCEHTYEEVASDKCEPYTDTVCKTTNVENCVDVPDRNCRGIVTANEVRQCFNVSELLCGLKEHVSYEVVQAVFTVQKCHKTTTRVCDTVFGTDTKPKDNFQCITTYNPYCTEKEETVKDRTCRKVTNFECPENQGKLIQGKNKYTCKKSYDTRCYDTPRTVSMTVCDPRQQRVCEKLSEQVAYPVEKQVCHDEVKKVCELEQRKQPKQVKKYSYSEDCRTEARNVCDNAVVKKLVQSCVPVTRKTCKLAPVEKCEEVKKQHCRRIIEHVPKEKCEEVEAAAGSYGS